MAIWPFTSNHLGKSKLKRVGGRIKVVNEHTSLIFFCLKPKPSRFTGSNNTWNPTISKILKICVPSISSKSTICRSYRRSGPIRTSMNHPQRYEKLICFSFPHCNHQRKTRWLERDLISHRRVRRSTLWAIKSTGIGGESYPNKVDELFSPRLNACLGGHAVFQFYFRTIHRDMKIKLYSILHISTTVCTFYFDSPSV